MRRPSFVDEFEGALLRAGQSSHEDEEPKHTCRCHPLGDLQLFQLLGCITSLLKVDVFYVLASQLILSVGERLDLFQHNVVYVEPGKLVQASERPIGTIDSLHVVE